MCRFTRAEPPPQLTVHGPCSHSLKTQSSLGAAWHSKGRARSSGAGLQEVVSSTAPVQCLPPPLPIVTIRRERLATPSQLAEQSLHGSHWPSSQSTSPPQGTSSLQLLYSLSKPFAGCPQGDISFAIVRDRHERPPLHVEVQYPHVDHWDHSASTGMQS